MSDLSTLNHYKLTIEEYHKLAEVGILNEDSRVELIEGELIQMVPIGPPRWSIVNRLNKLLVVHQTFVWVICQCRSRALLPSPTGRGTEVREKRLRIHVSSLTPTPLPEGEGLSCIDAPTQKSEGPCWLH